MALLVRRACSCGASARGRDTRPATERWLWLAVRGLVAYGALVIVAGTFATAAGPHAGGAGTATWSRGWTRGAPGR
jgi:uncharacterized protein (DUF697 family)